MNNNQTTFICKECRSQLPLTELANDIVYPDTCKECAYEEHMLLNYDL